MTDNQSDAASAPERESVNIKEADILRALPVKIRTHVRVSGLENIAPKVIAKDLEAIKRCENLEQVQLTVAAIESRWQRLGLFNSVQYNLEPTVDGNNNDVCVHVHVKENKPKKSIGLFTTDTALPEVKVSLDNIFGGRYSISGNYVPPTTRMKSLAFSLFSNVPFIGQSSEYSIEQRTESKYYQLASSERVNEIRAVTNNKKGVMSSEVTLGFQQRCMVAGVGQDQIPPELAQDFTNTEKGYIRHRLSLSNEAYHANPYLYNMYPLPIYGSSTHFTNEFAGGALGGKYTFLKSELQTTRYWPIGPFLSIQWSAKLAGIYPFFASRVPLNDRLFLSNCHVRGFKCIGPSTLDWEKPRERYAATGGNALWATSVSLNFPFIGFPNNGIAAMHIFANAGNLGMFDSISSASQNISKFVSGCAASVGGGIVITRIPLFGAAPSGRLELNYSIPVGVTKDGSLTMRNGNPNLFDNFRVGLVWSSNLSL